VRIILTVAVEGDDHLAPSLLKACGQRSRLA